MSDSAEIKNSITSLNNKIKEMGKHFLIYGVGSAMQGLVTFMLLPLLSNYFSVEDYGNYSLIFLVGILLGSFFYLGGQSAITRFYYEENIKEHQISVVTNTALIMLTGTLLCVIVGFACSPMISKLVFSNTSYWKIISWSSLASALGIINTYLITYLRILKKSSQFILVNLLNLTVNFISTFIFLKYSFFENYLMAPFIGQLLGLVVSISFSIWPTIQAFTISVIDFNKIKLYLLFSFPLVLKGFLFYIFEMSDRFVMESSLSINDVGIYSFGYQIGAIINLLFIVPFALIFSVLRMEYAKDKTSSVFFSRITTYYTGIGFAIVIILVLLSKNIISLASGSSEYIDAYKVTPWILFGKLILGYASIFDFGIYYSKKTYLYLLIYGSALFFNILLNVFFLEYFGYQFAAINKVASYIILVVFRYFVSNRYFVVKIEKRVWKLIASGVISLILIQLLLHFNYNLLYAVLIILLLGLCWYIKVLNKDEKYFILKIINKQIKFGKQQNKS